MYLSGNKENKVAPEAFRGSNGRISNPAFAAKQERLKVKIRTETVAKGVARILAIRSTSHFRSRKLNHSIRVSPYRRNEKFVETFHHVNQLQHI
ncbi:MAG: hypothetical protein OSB39_06240, partial [Opitutales bacterium]|nr:hypothetical protein [Opitutales bacterium]